jgi:hypothetical protein
MSIKNSSPLVGEVRVREKERDNRNFKILAIGILKLLGIWCLEFGNFRAVESCNKNQLLF